jgi:tetratricopeptide (TPR) repeat protein
MVQLGDVYGQARTLNQLGTLYMDTLGRLEEASTFFQQTVEKSVQSGDISMEGVGRNNLADTLRKLKRFDEARHEILRAIECKSESGHGARLWTSWARLADLETDAGNHTASARAKRNAIACYLAYRRDGGENHDLDGRISLAVTECLLAGDAATAASLIQQLATDPDLPSNARTYIRALQAIVEGSRDRTLADAPDLHYGMAAEILLLIEILEKRG